jgi:hypothetical protein
MVKRASFHPQGVHLAKLMAVPKEFRRKIQQNYFLLKLPMLIVSVAYFFGPGARSYDGFYRRCERATPLKKRFRFEKKNPAFGPSRSYFKNQKKSCSARLQPSISSTTAAAPIDIKACCCYGCFILLCSQISTITRV